LGALRQPEGSSRLVGAAAGGDVAIFFFSLSLPIGGEVGGSTAATPSKKIAVLLACCCSLKRIETGGIGGAGHPLDLLVGGCRHWPGRGAGGFVDRGRQRMPPHRDDGRAGVVRSLAWRSRHRAQELLAGRAASGEMEHRRLPLTSASPAAALVPIELKRGEGSCSIRLEILQQYQRRRLVTPARRCCGHGTERSTESLTIEHIRYPHARAESEKTRGRMPTAPAQTFLQRVEFQRASRASNWIVQ
jgi:hypothetical protein